MYSFPRFPCRRSMVAMSSAGAPAQRDRGPEVLQVLPRLVKYPSRVVVGSRRVLVPGDDGARFELLDPVQGVQPPRPRRNGRTGQPEVHAVVGHVAGDDQVEVRHVHDARDVDIARPDQDGADLLCPDHQVVTVDGLRHQRRFGDLAGEEAPPDP